MNFILKIFLLLFLFFTVYTISQKSSAEIVDMVAARVNDEVILLSDVRVRLKQITGIREALGQEKKKEMENNILEAMIEETLLVQSAKDLKFEIPDEEIDKILLGIKRENKLTDSQLKEIMKKEGILMEDYRNILKEQRMISILLNQEVNSKVHLEDDEIREYYKEHQKEFMTSEEVRVRHILIIVKGDSIETERALAKKKIEDILSRIKNKESFEELARLYSEDGSAVSGGDLGFFTRGKMIQAFEEVAFSLSPGEVSKIVRTDFGYHIIKCEQKRPSVSTDFEEVRPEIENRLFADKVEKRRKLFIEKLKEGAIIERRI